MEEMIMTIKELKKELNLEILASEEKMDQLTVDDIYIGDMLSWVIGNAETGSVWITIQTNVNIIAVAVMVGIHGILIAENASVDSETIERAEEEGIPLLRSDLTAYQIAKKINLRN